MRGIPHKAILYLILQFPTAVTGTGLLAPATPAAPGSGRQRAERTDPEQLRLTPQPQHPSLGGAEAGGPAACPELPT